MGAMFDEFRSVGVTSATQMDFLVCLFQKANQLEENKSPRMFDPAARRPSKKKTKIPNENEWNEESGRRLLVRVTRALAFFSRLRASVPIWVGIFWVAISAPADLSQHNQSFDQNIETTVHAPAASIYFFCGVYAVCFQLVARIMVAGQPFRDTRNIVQINKWKKLPSVGAADGAVAVSIFRAGRISPMMHETPVG